MKDRVIIEIHPTISQSFGGNFRAFVRIMHGGTVTTPTSVRLFSAPAGEAALTSFSSVSSIAKSPYPELIDLGPVIMPETSVLSGRSSWFTIQTARDDGLTYQLLDFILIPSDEWIVEVSSPKSAGATLQGSRSLIIDGVDQTDGLVAEIATDRGRIRWPASGAIAKLERNNTVKLWMLTFTDLSIGGDEAQATRVSFSNYVHSVSLEFIKEFLLGRGS